MAGMEAHSRTVNMSAENMEVKAKATVKSTSTIKSTTIKSSAIAKTSATIKSTVTGRATGTVKTSPASKSSSAVKSTAASKITASSEAIEVERWVQATQRVLASAGKPLHYLDIKRIIAENKLVPLGLRTSLEVALLKEVQRPGSRLIKIEGQNGIFKLATDEERLAQLEAHSKARAQAQGTPVPKAPVQPKAKARATHVSAVNGSVDKYRNKYLRLKKFLKHMVFLNAALCDEVVKVDASVTHVRDQRRYLLRRLQQYQVFPEVLPPPPPPPAAKPAPPPPAAPTVSPGVAPVKSSPPTTPPAVLDTKPDPEKLKIKKKATPNPKKKVPKEPVPVISGATSNPGLGELSKVKPKKTKASNSKRLVVPILLDNTGRPIFPIELGPLTVYSLGEITNDRSRYHSAEHIYPVGFCSTREYCSLRNPDTKTLYTCKILDCGLGPKFEISPEDAPEHVISCDSADECHTRLLAYVNNARGVEVVTPEPRGAEFFGFSHPTVQNLIQCCPGARKCSGYKWVRFEVCRTDPTEAMAFFNDEPVINFEALLQSQKYQQAMEEYKQMQQTTVLEPTSSLRSLLTSGPLLQGPHS